MLKHKQHEIDSYLKQIRILNNKIMKTKQELNEDQNFRKMIESENMAKENYR